MAAPLPWAIGHSRLPAHLKVTCHALALVADERQGFANIRLSKTSIGRYTSKSERIAREDMSDLVRFGVLTIVQQSRGGVGCATVYQLWFDRLSSWTDADTAELLRIRRARRVRPNGKADGKTRIRRSGLLHWNSDHKPGSGDPENPDPGIRGTRIRGSGDPSTDLRTDVRSASAVEREIPAVENSAALAAQSATGPRPNSAVFHLLSGIGRKLLAENGLGEVDWSELRSKLRSSAQRLGIAHRLTGDLLAGIEDSLRAQRDHFLASAGRTAPSGAIVAVRPSNEAEN